MTILFFFLLCIAIIMIVCAIRFAQGNATPDITRIFWITFAVYVVLKVLEGFHLLEGTF